MKITNFESLKNTCGNNDDYHRKWGRLSNKKGVYFWGFNLNDNGELPKKEDEILIYYIGKSQRNILERIMQEITQSIFGGYGPIIDHNFFKNNPFKARLIEKQEKLTDPDVIYRADGLHVLCCFFKDKKKKDTIDWMKERLIFCWIDVEDPKDINPMENEFHHIVRTNVFGVGRIRNLKPKKDINNPSKTPYFNGIDWSDNNILKEWFINVNNAIK